MTERFISVAAAVILSSGAASLPASAQSCSSGPCAQPHAQGGCAHPACCAAVCRIIEKCCTESWDQLCVDYAESVCVPLGVCGLATAGDCFSFHPNPACDDASCCEKVCGADPLCCTELWDALCAQQAFNLCSKPGGCGSPGSCLDPHPSGGCNDVECCELVCGIYPQCCEQAWDQLCTEAAFCYCLGKCSVTCPTSSVAELEACGTKSNDPCYNPGPTVQGQFLPATLPICGKLFVNQLPGGVIDADVDVFVAELGTAGSGNVTAVLTLTSNEPAWAALVPAPPFGQCNPLSMAVADVSSFHTLTSSVQVCVPAGRYWVVISAGEFPAIGEGELFPCADGLYVVSCTYTPGCASPCLTSKDSCFVPHATPGCGSPNGCCAEVCSLDAFCCDVEWDTTCAALAGTKCGGAAPPNDACADATPIAEGKAPFTTILATASGPAMPEACPPATADMGGDVWFVYAPAKAGTVHVSTCGTSDYDTRLAVYRGVACPPTILLGCNDDDLECAQGPHSTVTFVAECGESYLIRVGGHPGGSGTGTLTIDELGTTTCGCLGDITEDGAVDGLDLAAILGHWNQVGVGGIGDLNDDGIVDGLDLTIVLGHWGPC